MDARVRQIVASIRHILSTAFSRGAHQYFFSTLGAELGPLRTELETLTGLKLRSFLEQKFAAEIVPASDSNAALVLRRDVLDALDAADPHLRSVELPHLDEIPVSNCEAPEEAADTAAHGGLPRYRGGVWSAFVMPLDADKVRYLSTRTFTFFDIAAEDPVPSQVAEVKREMICPQDALDKPQRVQTSIFAWAESAKVDSKMLEVQPRKAGGHKQNPIYPWTSTNIIEPILTDSARYKKPEDALRLLESIRERFTCKKVASGEVREDHDYLWIFNYALTQDQQRRGEKGNYARLYIEKVGSRWHVRAEPVRDHDGWGAPAQPNRWQNKDHPNWSIRTLRKLQRGPMFFDSEDEARAEMDWLVDTFPKVLRFSDNKIGCMVYKRGPGGKGVAFDKVQIRLAYDQSDRPYLYMDWMFAEKHRAAQILAQPAREHSAKAVDGVIGSMFNAENEIEHRVAGHAARELLNWEGRGKYKASAVSGANHLYHYTSLQAMDAILEHRQAWLTDLRYMNDMSEIFHGHSVLTGFFANYASIVADVDGQPDKRRTAILAEAERLIAAKPIDDTIYALCLTDNVEVAAQWLTYGYHGSGVALGFDRDALADAAAAGGLDCGVSIIIPTARPILSIMWLSPFWMTRR